MSLLSLYCTLVLITEVICKPKVKPFSDIILLGQGDVGDFSTFQDKTNRLNYHYYTMSTINNTKTVIFDDNITFYANKNNSISSKLPYYSEYLYNNHQFSMCTSPKTGDIITCAGSYDNTQILCNMLINKASNPYWINLTNLFNETNIITIHPNVACSDTMYIISWIYYDDKKKSDNTYNDNIAYKIQYIELDLDGNILNATPLDLTSVTYFNNINIISNSFHSLYIGDKQYNYITYTALTITGYPQTNTTQFTDLLTEKDITDKVTTRVGIRVDLDSANNKDIMYRPVIRAYLAGPQCCVINLIKKGNTFVVHMSQWDKYASEVAYSYGIKTVDNLNHVLIIDLPFLTKQGYSYFMILFSYETFINGHIVYAYYDQIDGTYFVNNYAGTYELVQTKNSTIYGVSANVLQDSHILTISWIQNDGQNQSYAQSFTVTF